METLRLNDTTINNLSEGEYRDSQCHFLYVRIGKIKRTWYFLRTINKKTRRVNLGVFPDLNTIDARAEALKTAGTHSLQPRKSLTLSEAYNFYLKNRKPKSATELHYFFDYLKPFHDRKISAIKKADIQLLYSSIIADKKGHTANRVLSLIKVIISYGIQHGKIAGDVNGIRTIKKAFKEQPRTNFLGLADVKNLMLYLDKKLKQKTPIVLERQHRVIYLIIQTLILTGQRKMNVLQMEQSELDIDAGIWVIPAAKNKTGKEVVCHLAPELTSWLKKFMDENESGQYIFVNPKTGRPFTEIRKTWSRIQKELKFTATIHDLRRTCASLHVHHGASIKQIADTLGDSSLDMVSRVYAKTEASILRENTNKLSKLIYD